MLEDEHNIYGKLASERVLDDLACVVRAMRPEVSITSFRKVLEMNSECKHEGFMVRLLDGTTVMKLKSPHYLAKKFLMRMGAKKVDFMFNNKEELFKTLDEEFYGIVKYITRWWDAEKWKLVSEAERRAVIEKYFEANTQ